MSEKLFACNVCGLLYEKKEFADACRDFCSKHKACSPEIAKHSVGRK